MFILRRPGVVNFADIKIVAMFIKIIFKDLTKLYLANPE